MIVKCYLLSYFLNTYSDFSKTIWLKWSILNMHIPVHTLKTTSCITICPSQYTTTHLFYLLTSMWSLLYCNYFSPIFGDLFHLLDKTLTSNTFLKRPFYAFWGFSFPVVCYIRCVHAKVCWGLNPVLPPEGVSQTQYSLKRQIKQN